MSGMMPKSLGKYSIIEEIGRGGMAVVYKAVHPQLGRYVAIKVLPRQFTFETKFVQRFHREATAASTLSHPNIVIIHDVDQEDDLHYIVMEYLEGQPLSELIKEQGSLPLSRVFKIIDQISSALDYAHSLGFVHRDIKPSNIIIGPEDHATLTDFGIVRTADGTSVTKEGAPIGTPEYMSPEQCDGKQADSRSDLYSLGIVLYEMVTGQVPFTADTPLVVMYQQVNKKPVSPRRINPDVSEPVERVVLRALAKEPDERYATAGALAEALEAAVRGEELPAPTEPVLDERAVESLYVRAFTAVEEKRWQEAIEWLNQVLRLNERYRDARDLLKRAEQELAQEERAATLKQRGIELLGQGRFREAVESLRSALSLHPEDEELSELLAQAQKEAEEEEAERVRLDRAEEELTRQEAVTELKARGKRLLKQQDAREAIEAFQSALSLQPSDEELSELLARAEALAEEDETDKAGIRRAEELHKQGKRFIRQEQWAQAVTCLQEAMSLAPEDRELASLLAQAEDGLQAQRAIEDLYREGTEALKVEDWERAIERFGQVLLKRPSHTSARGMLQEAQRGKELARKYVNAQELMAKAKWPEAIKLLEEIRAEEPGYKESQQSLRVARVAMARQRPPEVQEEEVPAAPPEDVPIEEVSISRRLRDVLVRPNASLLMASSALLGFVLVQLSYWLLLPKLAGPLAAILPPVTALSTGPESNQGGAAPDLIPTFTPTATWTPTATSSPTATSTATNTPTATPPPTATALPPTPTRMATPRPATAVPATPTAVPLQAPPGMVYMAAGETRAADGGVLSYEAHFIDDHAVTWGEYEACVRDTYCSRIAQVYMLVPGEGHSYQLARIQNYMPVHRATWYDADRYCRWAGKRLPTLAEWRSACENASGWNRSMLWATGQLTVPEWVADPVVGTEERVLCLDGCYSTVGKSPLDAPGSNDALWDCLRGPDPASCSRGFRCARTVE